jgi:hypothetical protein
VSRIAADLIVVLHLSFVLFVVLGGLLVLRWRRLAFLHAPAVVWGVTIEWAGWICPLTPLENFLRRRSGGVALALNLLVYWRAFRKPYVSMV